MAYERPHGLITKIATVDLSASQYRFVEQDTAAALNCVLPSAGGRALGVVQNKPSVGLPATVATGGDSKVIAGGALTVGARVMSDVSGRAVAWTTGNVILGICQLAASGAGLVTTVRLTIGQATA